MEVNHNHISLADVNLHRREFYRKAICEAQAEFSKLESAHKAMEVALLTAMGTLGAAIGFNIMLQTDVEGLKITSRGLAPGEIDFLRDNYQSLNNYYFSSVHTAHHPFQAVAKKVITDPRDGDPLNSLAIRLIVGWRIGSDSVGLLGIGDKIVGQVYSNAEVDFLLNLCDRMMMSLHSISNKALFHALENELQQARQRSADGALRASTMKKDLEQTRFRLAGFNDLFHELSGLTTGSQVMDTFLLVLSGIFSAQDGYLFFWDDAMGAGHVAYRGISGQSEGPIEGDDAQTIVGQIFSAGPAARLDAMEATVVSFDQFKNLYQRAHNGEIGILFKIDDSARGVMALGRRLTHDQYGAREYELLLAFTHIFLVFLKNSKSFETIQRLNTEQRQKNIELEKTVQELSAARSSIAGFEKAREQIKSALAKTMARTTRISFIDIAAILCAGIVLGLAYNFASPGRIDVIPHVWRVPPADRIGVEQTKTLADRQQTLIIDARPAEFYKQQHIADALNLPLALFDLIYMMRFSQYDLNQPIIVYGRTFSRRYDEEVAYKLKQRGHLNIAVLDGGLRKWQARGYATAP